MLVTIEWASFGLIEQPKCTNWFLMCNNSRNKLYSSLSIISCSRAKLTKFKILGNRLLKLKSILSNKRLNVISSNVTLDIIAALTPSCLTGV